MMMHKGCFSLCLILGAVLCSCQTTEFHGATREEKTEALAELLPEWKPRTLVNQFGRARTIQLFNNLTLDPTTPRIDATSTGQASVLTPDGYALTATHVLNDGPVSVLKLKSPRPGQLALTEAGPVYFSPRRPDQPQRVRISDLEALPIQIVLRFKGSDLALIKLPISSPRTFVMTDKPPAKGTPLFAYGSNLSGNSSAGRTHRVVDYRSVRTSSTIPHIYTSIPLQKGDSGGPVMNADGHLVGIISRSQSALFADSQTPTIALRISPHALRSIIDKDRSKQ